MGSLKLSKAMTSMRMARMMLAPAAETRMVSRAEELLSNWSSRRLIEMTKKALMLGQQDKTKWLHRDLSTMHPRRVRQRRRLKGQQTSLMTQPMLLKNRPMMQLPSQLLYLMQEMGIKLLNKTNMKLPKRRPPADPV
jgi:hypothetical protein